MPKRKARAGGNDVSDHEHEGHDDIKGGGTGGAGGTFHLARLTNRLRLK